MSQYTINDSNNCLNTTNSFNNVWNYTFADDRSQLLTWLSPLEPSLRHCDIRERRVNDIGEWLIQAEEFRRWCEFDREGESEEAVLFCYGDPGVGKTFMSSLVADRLCDHARGRNAAVACFYFDFAARKEHSAISMLGSLVKQIISGMERIPEEISRAFQEQKRTLGGCRPQLVDIAKMLQATTSSQPTFICIDALDECEGVQRSRILGSLKQILEMSPGTRIFMTGRPHIRAEIEKRLAGRVIGVHLCPKKHDIITYIRARLGEDETPDAMDENLEADIIEKIPQNISEMFLLVSLNIDSILQESTIHRRRERLEKMTDALGLGDAYGMTIERIKAQGGDKSKLGMAALMWISHAERHLRAEELCHALAVELGSKDFNAANTPSISTLVGCCQGLIIVDKEASTVRLIHFTLQEYLSAHQGVFNRPDSAMAEICLTYLNSKQARVLSGPRSPETRETSFLGYCSLYWGVHAKRDLSDRARSLALELFRQYDGHISQALLLEEFFVDWWTGFRGYSSFSALHYASFFGIVDLVAALMEMKCYDINERGILGYTPLAWAVCNGHEEVAKVLLESKEVNPNRPDSLGQTPLSLAAEAGNEGLVKILLGEDDIYPDKTDRGGKAPLLYAAENGHEGVVKILLDCEEVDPDKPERDGRTPLSHAAEYGHEGVVKILLGREEVNPHRLDDTGRTPLAYAAQKGHKEVVKMILADEGVNPDKLETWGTTQLWYGATSGDERAAKTLLEREEATPDKPDNAGRTLLSYAASNGHEEVVNILLGHEEVNPDKPDNCGQTPLSHAAENGHEGVVKLLLGSEQVKPDKPNNWGQTPLSYAAMKGHEGVVKILIQLEEVDLDNASGNGQTPLSFAADYGYEGVVKILLGSEQVKPDTPNNWGKTPLSFAAESGHEGIVRILLGLDEVNPDKACGHGQTPLSYAAQFGHEGVVKLLLAREEVTLDRPDNFGETPMTYAASRGRKEVVAVLQSHGKMITPCTT